MLQDILQELSEGAEKTGMSNAADTIVANIKNTMSERAAAQKSFNALLATYRSDILPSVVNNWNSLSNDEQSTMSQMNNFYCGMHLVVNMAERTSESLKLVERNFDSQATHAICTEHESGTVRLIRTACKAFEKRGDEKSGCPLHFEAYLNVVFTNGARVYYLHQHMADFLKSWGTSNRILRAVLEDVSSVTHVAVGLIDKHITGPLWRILESGIHILDLPPYYSKLKEFVETSTEA